MARSMRARVMRQMHQWHWISSALCLIGMILFAATGITLNHASQILATPVVTHLQGSLPPELRSALQAMAPAREADRLPPALTDWLDAQWSLQTGDRLAEWTEDELYLSLPRPGADGWISVDLASGAVEAELIDRGWIAYLNDLHKGRHAGVVWTWFIDLFAIACLVFCITGLILLKLHAAHRATTWPVVGLGLIVPVVLLALFVH
jgi:hypothetical protein